MLLVTVLQDPLGQAGVTQMPKNPYDKVQLSESRFKLEVTGYWNVILL